MDWIKSTISQSIFFCFRVPLTKAIVIVDTTRIQVYITSCIYQHQRWFVFNLDKFYADFIEVLLLKVML